MALRDWLSRWAAKIVAPDIFRELVQRQQSAAGKYVSVDTALKVSTVLGCARVIAEGIAQVPFKLLRETGDRREPARDHPLYEVLELQPNPWQTSFEFREQMGLHLALCGRFVAFRNRNSRGQLLELLPFEPGDVTVKRAEDWTLTYEVRGKNGRTEIFPAEAIWHVRGPSWNGYLGLETVKLARDAIGLAMAAEESHSKLHANGVQTAGMLSVEGVLKEGDFERLKKWIEDNYEGPANAYKTMIMDRSTKFTTRTRSGKEEEHLETRRHQVEDICRFFRVMPIMVGFSDKVATYASAEQMFLAHVVHTLAPWYQRIEQSVDVNLLTEKDRKEGLYAKFIEEGLLRGAAKDTKDVIIGYVNGGLMTPNEGRAKLDLNPDADPKSNELRIPANVVGDPTKTEPAPAA